MEWLINDALPVVAKFFLVVIFPFSALDKIVNWGAALEQANSGVLPGGPVLLVLAMIVEFVTPVCIVVGWYEGWAALVLAAVKLVEARLTETLLKLNTIARHASTPPGHSMVPVLYHTRQAEKDA